MLLRMPNSALRLSLQTRGLQDTIASYERVMQAPLFHLVILVMVKSLLNLLFVPPFLVHTVTSDAGAP